MPGYAPFPPPPPARPPPLPSFLPSKFSRGVSKIWHCLPFRGYQYYGTAAGFLSLPHYISGNTLAFGYTPSSHPSSSLPTKRPQMGFEHSHGVLIRKHQHYTTTTGFLSLLHFIVGSTLVTGYTLHPLPSSLPTNRSRVGFLYFRGLLFRGHRLFATTSGFLSLLHFTLHKNLLVSAPVPLPLFPPNGHRWVSNILSITAYCSGDT